MMISYTKCTKNSNNDDENDEDYTFESRNVVFIFFLQLNKFLSPCENIGLDFDLD